MPIVSEGRHRGILRPHFFEVGLENEPICMFILIRLKVFTRIIEYVFIYSAHLHAWLIVHNIGG